MSGIFKTKNIKHTALLNPPILTALCTIAPNIIGKLINEKIQSIKEHIYVIVIVVFIML
jgi:hypothetical protein